GYHRHVDPGFTRSLPEFAEVTELLSRSKVSLPKRDHGWRREPNSLWRGRARSDPGHDHSASHPGVMLSGYRNGETGTAGDRSNIRKSGASHRRRGQIKREPLCLGK